MSELEQMSHALRVVQETVIQLTAAISAFQFVLISEGIVTEERLEIIKNRAIEIAQQRVAERNN